MKLEDFGWTPFFARALADLGRDAAHVGRVFADNRGIYSLYTEAGEVDATLSGRFRHAGEAWPVTGDWVVCRDRSIDAVLPRRTRISRKQAGAKTVEQVLAANIDVIFLVSALDRDFNLRRIERALVLALESGAAPVIVLNKADRAADVEGSLLATQAVAGDVPVLAVSALTGNGLADLSHLVQPGQSAALIGSSGVGKSTLVNGLLGYDRQRVRDVRDSDQRGRHTTTGRELILLAAGWLILDTPGLRELQLWSTGDAIDRAFEEIGEIAARCRFRDCRHEGEPGCAVAAALADESLDAARFRSFAKLRRETEHLEREQDALARLEHKRKWKAIHRAAKKMYKQRW